MTVKNNKQERIRVKSIEEIEYKTATQILIDIIIQLIDWTIKGTLLFCVLIIILN